MSSFLVETAAVDAADMTSSEYIAGAIRTESNRFDHQNVSPETIEAALRLFVAAGQALDVIKRGLYYGKPMNQQKLHDAMRAASLAVELYNVPAATTSLPGYSANPAVSRRIVHAALGLGTESAEILEKVLASFRSGEEFDYANFFEENSDIEWYQAIGIDAAKNEDDASSVHAHPQLANPVENGFRDWSFESIWEKNIAKLRARYPDRFETTRAYERDIAAEKKALGE